jgi:antagonist of KipI
VGLIVENPGVFSTIQDRGRAGYRGLGVPTGGAFDLEGHELANALVGNDADAATIEMTLMGGSYRAQVSLAIALAGAPMVAAIESTRKTPFRGAKGDITGSGRGANGDDASASMASGIEHTRPQQRLLAVPCSASLEAGDRLVLGGCSTGARTYLAVRGGWQSPVILGSRSSETPLRPGQELAANTSAALERRPAEWRLPDAETEPIRVVVGPDARDVWPLESLEFTVTAQSNRMGLRLEGPAIEWPSNSERVSAPVAFGAVQLAGGQLIILGPGGGTMGGYVHLGQVISADLPHIGQARPGTRIRFERIEIDRARELDRQDRERRKALCQRIRLMAQGSD